MRIDALPAFVPTNGPLAFIRLGRLVAVLCLLLWAIAGAAVEKIERFESNIEIQADGSMVVTETITVTAEGMQIRRGIYRDFPTDYRDRFNNRVRVDFDMLGAKRDGEVENYRTEKQSNGVRVYLGRADHFLTPGRYRYQIHYRTDHQLGFFDDFDELYWNVTGNGWAFEIEAAGATVRLPEPVQPERIDLTAYTGYQGATGRDFSAEVVEPGVARFSTTRRLRGAEGLTIVVGFPKGVVDEPGPVDRLWRLLTDNAGVLVGILGLTGVIWFYLRAWRQVGRDPEKGVIIPRYESPEGYSPASLRYILRMKYDATCMAAALVNLAVKGALRIERKRKFLSKKFSVHKLDTTGVAFAPGEQALFQKLLPAGRDELSFETDNHTSIQGALKAHKASLARDYYRKYFVYNGDKIALGAGLSVAAVVAMALLGGIETVAGIGLIVVLVVVNLLFALWMKAPTMHGRKLMDHIEGLRLYLGVAERQDLERQQEPPQTFEEFEKLLPYAVALDCASTWVDRFESVLRGLEQSGELKQRGWYSGDTISARGIARSVDGLSSSLGSSISSSSTPPGSSSGGGGGSSGGGGGGGGGGGW